MGTWTLREISVDKCSVAKNRYEIGWSTWALLDAVLCISSLVMGAPKIKDPASALVKTLQIARQ